MEKCYSLWAELLIQLQSNTWCLSIPFSKLCGRCEAPSKKLLRLVCATSDKNGWPPPPKKKKKKEEEEEEEETTHL
jgi:hypothetical protein